MAAGSARGSGRSFTLAVPCAGHLLAAGNLVQCYVRLMLMEITRRGALGILASAASATGAQTSGGDAVSLNWLGGEPPPLESGVSWGVPWARGAVGRDQAFALTTADGKALPVRSWTLAYWPDGSIKWTGFATVAGPAAAGALKVAPGSSAAPALAVKVADGREAVAIDTGKLQCRIPRGGP